MPESEWPLAGFDLECVQAVQRGSFTITEVMAVTGQNKSRVTNTMGRLVRRGVLRAVRRPDRHFEHSLRGRLEPRGDGMVFIVESEAPASDTWGPLQRRILEVMDDGRCRTAVTVAERIGENTSSTYRCMLRLERDGVLDYANFEKAMEWKEFSDEAMPPEKAEFRLAKNWRGTWREKGPRPMD